MHYNLKVDLLELLLSLQHGRNDINLDLKKEADYFGDIVIVPYMDTYDLVVLKTVAICEYGVSGRAATFTLFILFVYNYAIIIILVSDKFIL